MSWWPSRLPPHSDLRAGGGAGRQHGQLAIPSCSNGFSGVLTGSAIVFFSVHRLRFGFDAREECRNPQRDLPFGIIT